MNQAITTPQPPTWRTEFKKQATEETMTFVLKYAQSLTSQVERWTKKRDPASAEDRLHTAIVGTLGEQLRWDPERVDLKGHLIGAIASRISHDLRHAKQFHPVSLDSDDARNGDELDRAVTTALTAERASPDDQQIDACFAASMAHLRVLAQGDPPVLHLLDAFDQRVTERADVMEHTGMSARTYHAARQRLVRLAKKLPLEVREAATQAMA